MGNINWDDISDEELEALIKHIPEYKPSDKMKKEMFRRLMKLPGNRHKGSRLYKK